MVSKGRRLVVDASVVAKWHLKDETLAEEALRLLEDFTYGKVELLAPDHIRYEVANAINVAVYRGRISEEQGRIALIDFLDLASLLTLYGESKLISNGFDKAQLFGCAFYDGLYLALAEDTQCQFIYADDSLGRLIKDKASYALWIGEYSQ